jgi:hypothetical protein
MSAAGWDALELALDDARDRSIRTARYTRLGTTQREVLRYLLAHAVRQSTREALRGVPWRTEAESRAESALLSRALRELEGRGLVVRFDANGERGVPTRRVLLTPAGLVAAKVVDRQEAA